MRLASFALVQLEEQCLAKCYLPSDAGRLNFLNDEQAEYPQCFPPQGEGGQVDSVQRLMNFPKGRESIATTHTERVGGINADTGPTWLSPQMLDRELLLAQVLHPNTLVCCQPLLWHGEQWNLRALLPAVQQGVKPTPHGRMAPRPAAQFMQCLQAAPW